MRMAKGISMGGGTMVTDGILDDRNGHGCRTKTAAHRGYCYKRRRGLA